MSRTRLLSMIDPMRQRGLEIGALNQPMVTRDMGPVEYVDRSTRAELQAWYAGHRVDAEAIVEVDHIWGDKSLLECVGGRRVYDYLVASHVIEHVPDLFGWLGEIASVLTDGGLALFMVPDKRHTFDVLRPPSVSGDFVDAYLRGLRRPDVRQIFNSIYDTRDLEADAALDDEALTARARHALTVCRDATASADYIDVHCWVFTPRSMVEALDLGSRLGLLPFEIAAVDPSLGEFLLALRRLPDEAGPEAQRAAFLESLHKLELAPEAPSADGEPGVLLAKAEIALAQAKAIEDSTIWRMTAPVRAVIDRLRAARQLSRRRSLP